MSDGLELPEGALIAMSKSGGLRFSTRGLVVYSDGHGRYDIGPRAGRPAQSGALELTESQLARLRRTIAGIDFSRLPARLERVNPDAFVYEIAVRTLGREYHVETSEGNIPPALKPLIDQLRRLMPSD